VTNVHPLWVATPLVAFRQELIEKRSGKMMTPAFVAKEVTDQIFACRGTQLVIPRSHSFLSTTRAWPVWLLDTLKGLGAVTREEMEAAAKKL
jgi:all-trans-retinol dehydrogenase (NAD+)